MIKRRVVKCFLASIVPLGVLNYVLLSLMTSPACKEPNQVSSVNSTWFETPSLDEQLAANMSAIRSSALIFVGGMSRSGTTLMRAILDVHSQIRCGPETKILLDLLCSEIYSPKNEWREKTPIRPEDVDDSMAFFIYNIIAHNGPRASRLCMKDPGTFSYIGYLSRLFPRAKFVYMVRDGRAVTLSLIRHRGTQFSQANFESVLAKWNNFNADVNEQCQELGPQICMLVQYEDLVEENEQTVRRIIDFLGENFEPGMLEHEKFIGSEIQIAKRTWSGSQVKRPLYNNSLTSWMTQVPYLNESETRRIAPMLEKFGYTLTFEPAVVEAQKAAASTNGSIFL